MRLTDRRIQILREYYQIHKRPAGAPVHPSWVTPNEIAERLHMPRSYVYALLHGHTEIITKEEIKHSKYPTRGEKNNHAKLTEDDVRCIRRDPRQNIIIASDYGVNHSTIAHIKLRLSWRHVI